MTEKQQRQEVRRFFELINNKYTGDIDLFYINRAHLLGKSPKGRLKIATLPTRRAYYKLISDENALWKNRKRGESVYWTYATNTNLTLAFVDDIGDIDRFIKENHFLLVQTSQHKYQAYFALSKPVDSYKLHYIQAKLAQEYKGDKAATGWSQLKRVAGFINTKYDDDFIVKIVHVGSNVLDVSKISPKNAQNEFERYKHTGGSHLEANRGVSLDLRGSINKTWEDFYGGDESQADMKYAVYLLGHGFSIDEVKQKLLQESLDIETRKAGHLEHYLELTTSKAYEYVLKNNVFLKRAVK